MKIKGRFIKTKLVFTLFILLVVPACELFLPFPENEELKLEGLILNSPTNESINTLDYANYIELVWKDIDEDKNYQVDFELYLSENPNPGLYKTDITDNYCAVKLAKNKVYYWKVIAKLDDKFIESEVWSFTTE